MVLIPSPEHDPHHRLHVKGAELNLLIVLAGMQRVEIKAAIDTQNDGLTIEHKLLDAIL